MLGSRFFSRLIMIRSAFTWSGEIKKIREMLGDIVNDHQHDFGLMRHSIDLRVRHILRETHSFVCEDGDVIIGRDEDKQIVMDMLVDTSVQENVSLISIVGIGGLGKTTLAQIVYNDDMIRREFPLKMWVCVSNDFNVKALLGQIVAAATNKSDKDDMSMDQLQMKLRQQLDGIKYLLVLDDVWNEDCEEWRKFKSLLVGGRGSKIIVTTRSKKVANVMGSYWAHELKGLSDEDSWNLFQRMALEQGQHQVEANLVNVGKEIVRKCSNVPLAIRVVGSLLRGQNKTRWQYMKNTDLANIKQDEINGIIPVLKISYNYLPFHLKSCFSYCAVFPKDYKIVKEDLICLWMAQGFITQSDGVSLEDTGEEYFMQLLQKRFFQDVKRARGTDEIISCKMHDLIHDVAKEAAGTEILLCTYNTRCVNEKTRHVYIDRGTPEDYFGNLAKIKRMRTLLGPFSSRNPDVLSKVKYLRVLHLRKIKKLTTLPSVIGELLHLRYLDLSDNMSLLVLPSSVTKLYNLQTLKLQECWFLKRLPKALKNLVNLRRLDIYDCIRLTQMPPGMSSMTSLQKLTGFVVGGSSNASNLESAGVQELENLKVLTNQSEVLGIYIQKDVRFDAVQAREGGFLLKSTKLRKIKYWWHISVNGKEGIINAEALLHGLQPHSHLKMLELQNYPGVKFPKWGGSSMNLNSCLPHLVEIQLSECIRLEHLPLMSQLRHLKVLKLSYLNKVEYVESSSNVIEDEANDDEVVFFPSLETLVLYKMPKLRGWWKSESESGKIETRFQSDSYLFYQLSYLRIEGCHKLTTFPFCPKLEELELHNYKGAPGFIVNASTHGLSSSLNNKNRQKMKLEVERQRIRLRKVMIDNVGYLNFLPIESFQYLSHLEITSCWSMERLTIGEVGEVFRSGRLSSLRSLEITCCSELKSISGRVWDHFTALESLDLRYNIKLELEDEDDVSSESTAERCINEGSDAEMPWRYLSPTLRSLKLVDLPKLVKLPKGMGCLSSIQSLEIKDCDNLETLTPSIGGLSSLQSLNISSCTKLKTMPEEMRHLTCLTQLEVRECSLELKNRCEKQTGADWPNIKHITHIEVYPGKKRL